MDLDSREFDVHDDFLEFNVVEGGSVDGHGVLLSFDGVGSEGNGADLDSGGSSGAVGEVVGDVGKFQVLSEEGLDERGLAGLDRGGSIDVEGDDVSKFSSGEEVVGSIVLFEGFDVVKDLTEVLEEVHESLFSFFFVSEGGFDFGEPGFSFCDGELAVRSLGPESLVSVEEFLNGLDH